MTLSLREREYVSPARYLGVSAQRIILRHLLPNMSSLLIIDATIEVATAIIAESGLSYFGFGVTAAGRLARHPDRRGHAVGLHLPVAVHVLRRPAGPDHAGVSVSATACGTPSTRHPSARGETGDHRTSRRPAVPTGSPARSTA